ncbi:MAG: CRISPR-associated RAMP protein Csx7 [Thermoplasmatales archaeon]|nr:CRISPR-associated RAMP protein Csx7 [Candidatus Methanoperedenaceae archaeon]MCG2826303.1 CRISPR-associated RAMP protein Csx7 [Thermoplasmatales archaeon]
MSDFSSFENRYYISADIIMERPLHIGRGASLEPLGTDLPVIKTSDNNPYIPGSSIKGVLRAQFEKYLRAMDSQNIKLNGKKLHACDILDEKKRCISIEKRNSIEKEVNYECKKNPAKIYDEELTERIIKNSCTACRLFGSHEMASKVYIKDAFLEGSIKTEIRDGVAIDRDTGTAKSGAKFDYEIVPAGATFRFETILENTEPHEVGLFGLILKSWERGDIAVGGKTSAGMGWGVLKNLKLEYVEISDIVDFLVSGTKKGADLSKFVNQLKEVLKKEVNANA